MEVTIRRGGGSTTSRYEDVREWGAVGDWKTDDTEAIQGALESGSGTVFIPEGDYRVTEPLTPDDEVSLEGENPYTTTIHQEDGSKHGVDLEGADNLSIESLGITHDWGLAKQGRGQLLFSDDPCENVTVRNCRLYESARQGVGFWSRENNNIRFLNNDIEKTARAGAVLFGKNLHVARCYVDQTGDDGIALNTDATSQCSITQNIVLNGAGAGEMTGGGIKFHGSRMGVSYNIVVGSNQYGIRGQMVDNETNPSLSPTQNAVRGNIVVGLTDLNPKTKATAGIEMRDFHNIRIEDNGVYAVKPFDGIRVRNHHGSTTRSRLEDNYIEGARFGIYYKNPHEYARVGSNTVHDATRAMLIGDPIGTLLFKDNDGSNVGRCVHFSGPTTGTYHLEGNQFSGVSAIAEGSVGGGEIRNYLNTPEEVAADVRNGATTYKAARWSDITA